MEKLSEQFARFKDLLTEYFEYNVEYYKLTGFEKLMRLVIAMVSTAIVIMVGAFAILLFAIGSAIWLGKLLENEAGGYWIVGSIVLLLLLLVFVFKKQLIERPLIKTFTFILFQDDGKQKPD